MGHTAVGQHGAVSRPCCVASPGALAALQAHGVEGPTDQPGDVRDCTVRDPVGNLIKVQQAG